MKKPTAAQFRIAEISADQWARWRDVRLAALRESPSAFESTYAQWQSAPESRWRKRLDSVELNLIAEPSDPASQPLGIASGTRIKGDSAVELISMWVAPAARGVGVADALISGVEDWARGFAPELWLAITPGNYRAAALYRRNGFSLSDELGAPTAGGFGRELLMVKKLG